LRALVRQPDEALVGGPLDLAEQDLLGGGDDSGLAARSVFVGFHERRRRGRGDGVAIGHVEGEIAGADEGGADPAVAAEIDGDGGARGVGRGGHRQDAAARDPVEGAVGAEVEPAAGEAQDGALGAGLERPLGRRLDGQDDAGEAVVLAAADRPAFGGGQRGGAAEERREAEGGGPHAARLCLEARSAPSSSL
jgi:hypothetical protein